MTSVEAQKKLDTKGGGSCRSSARFADACENKKRE